MSPCHNLLVFMLAALLFGSVISHAPVPRPLSPVVQPPSVIHVPIPSPAVAPLSPHGTPVESPVPTPEVEPPSSPAISPSFSPVVPPVYSPSISMPPAEAPAPESNAALNRVSTGFVAFGAFVVAFMA